jgi:hypothetical protein
MSFRKYYQGDKVKEDEMRVGWGRVARMGNMRNIYIYIKFWLESLKGRDHSEDPGVDGKRILEWILRK